MSREPMRVGKDSTEPVNPISGLTPTEDAWETTARNHIRQLNRLLEERGSAIRYRLIKES